MKKLRSSKVASLALKWVKHSFSVYPVSIVDEIVHSPFLETTLLDNYLNL